jgi:hypothetical protein
MLNALTPDTWWADAAKGGRGSGSFKGNGSGSGGGAMRDEDVRKVSHFVPNAGFSHAVTG